MGLLSSAIAPPALAQDAPGLAPSSDWTLDYDDDSCALRRMFGTGDDQAFLELRRFGPGPALQAVVGSNRLNARQNAGFRYRFGASNEWREVGVPLTAKLADGFEGLIFSPYLLGPPDNDAAVDMPERLLYLMSARFNADEVAQASAMDTMTLSRGFSRELTLQTGSLAAPIAALNECVAELTTHWNIDVEAHKTLTRAAVPTNLPGIGRMMDYPPKMAEQRMPGLVNVRLGIDPAGLITDCRIQMPLSDPAFEKSSCADIQHALDFDPALDKDGKPIASYWVTKVFFQMRNW
jgi:hypothetical protein